MSEAVPPSPFACGLNGLCPRCGENTLFVGLVKFAERCRACGLDFSAYNVGDGPAGFLTLVVGAFVTALAITLELKAQPPVWLHFVLWLPVTVVAVFASLRIAKGMLLALEHRNKAGEGQSIAADESDLS